MHNHKIKPNMTKYDFKKNINTMIKLDHNRLKSRTTANANLFPNCNNGVVRSSLRDKDWSGGLLCWDGDKTVGADFPLHRSFQNLAPFPALPCISS